MKTNTLKLILSQFILVIFCFQSKAQNIDTLAGRNLYFDGSSNYVDTKDTTWYQAFTVECWVKSPTAPGFAQGNGPVHYEKNFQINWNHVQSSARNSLVLFVTNGGWQSATFGPLEGNKWYHMAATYDGDTIRTFVNGMLITQKIINGGPPVKQVGSLKIGKHAILSGTEFFNGNVDEVRVWNIKRSAEQIRLNMFHPLAGNESGLKQYYQFKEFQADSTLNAVSGKFAPMVSNPEIQKSEFPYGKGISTIFNVQAGSNQFFNSNEVGLVALQIDSVNRPFPLLFTKIKAGFNGPKPDTALYNTHQNPYWIIQALDTGKTFKGKGMRFDQNALSPEITMNANKPSDIKVFNRAFTSTGEWQYVDTCQFIAFGSGHFIFDGFTEGQMALGMAALPTSASAVISTRKVEPRLHYKHQKELVLFLSKEDNFSDAILVDLYGRELNTWQLTPNTDVQNQILRLQKPIDSGLYFLKLKGNNSGFTIRFMGN